jgi:hypothetical protein
LSRSSVAAKGQRFLGSGGSCVLCANPAGRKTKLIRNFGESFVGNIAPRRLENDGPAAWIPPSGPGQPGFSPFKICTTVGIGSSEDVTAEAVHGYYRAWLQCDPGFRQALWARTLRTFSPMRGNQEDLLRDLITATIGFAKLSDVTHPRRKVECGWSERAVTPGLAM